MVTEQVGVRSWREERREDERNRARIVREGEEARAKGRIAELEARTEAKRQAADARKQARQSARDARAARRAAMAGWVQAHTVDLLFLPVVIVPGVLAWTGMAAYGAAQYGPPGLALPALSEGGMWTFAAATTIRIREDDRKRELEPNAEPRPVWHLRLGTLIFAVYGAALNFLHGLAEGGPVTGATMALVSVAGVTAHQLITAGPLRSRADRDRARIARLIARREHAASRAAVRRAPVELDEHGNARLILTPGRAQVGTRHGRTVLTMTPAPAQPEPDRAGTGQAAAQTVQARPWAPLGFFLKWNPAWPVTHLGQPPAGHPEVAETPKTFPGNVDNPGGDDPARTDPPGGEPPAPGGTGRAHPVEQDRLSGTDRAAAEQWLEMQDREDDDEYTRARNALRRSTLAGNPLSGRQLRERYGISRAQQEEIVEHVRDGT